MMLKNVIEAARALARPYLVYLFGAALVGAAFIDGGAFDRLKEPALLVIGYYVGSRTQVESK